MDVSEVRTGFTQHRDEVGVQVQQQFQHFLEEFQEDGEIKYLAPIVELTGMGRDSLEVSMRDIEKFNNTLNDTIIEEYYRVAPFLNQALSNVVKDRAPEKINKEVYVNLIDVVEEVSLRQLRSSKVGSLVRIKGQVVRTYPVHPELIRGTFICQDCQTVIKEVEQEFKFTYPVICRNPVCNNRRRFELDNEKSVFVDFQKLKIQEMQEEMPRGSIPKSFDIIVRAEIVETVQAGDRYYFSGTLIVIPDVANIALPGVRAEPSSRHKTGDNVTDGVRGLKSLGVRDLNYRFAFLACSIVPTHPRLFGTEIPGELSAEIIKQQMSDEEWQEVYKMSRDKNLFNNLINSLFPNIYGNDQVKKGILLMLFGGVSKKTVGGNTLRGDINCLIVGDPSTAKSQFLKQVAKFVPRSVYTSGKASTAAGLTAAVVRDEESADFVIEAGALLLADNGICCIDEFDKMDTRDQVAIHEAMEQQTISLAKAGVRASLNARTSILAAANPVSGRYDRTKSLQQNVNLSAPIMSRFDLFFVILDECNEVTDCAIADRILRSRRNYLKGKSDYGDGATVYSKKMILNYIIFAKQFKPLITPEAKEKLVDYYDEMRQRDSQNTKNCWRTTVRQLESMIRLSEAMARMACSDFVTVKHVDESYQLLKKSIIRIEQPDINLDGDTPDAPLQAIIEEDEEAVDDPPQSQPAVGVQKNTLSFDEYKRLTNSLVIFIRKEDTKRTEAAEAGVSPYEGVRKSEVVDEYLSWMGDEIESEDDLRTKKSFIEKVIDRLINHDQILIPLDPPGPPRIDDEGEEEERDPIIIVHPSYLTDL